MVIKVRKLTWGPFTSGGDGAACVYTGAKVDSDKIVRVDMSEDAQKQDFYTDDHRIDSDNSISGANVSIELAKLTDEMRTAVLGYEEATSDILVTSKPAPYVGVGFIHGDVYKGTTTYRAYWYFKVQFTRGNRTFNTKGESVSYQTESLEGSAVAVQLSSGGSDVFYADSGELSTEAAAEAWLKTKAGISQ